MNGKLNLRLVYLALRRRYLFFFRKKYVQESLSKRKGGCKMCPCCFTRGLLNKGGRCPHLNGNRCDIFDSAKLPLFCRVYPIDEKDKTPFSQKNCGFYWD